MLQNKKNSIYIISFLLISIISFLFLPFISEAKMMQNILNVDPETYSQQLQNKFEYWSKVSGIDVNKIKNYWAQGKSFREMLALEKVDFNKVQEKVREYKLDQLKKNIQELVEKGIITQEQANQRLGTYSNRLKYGPRIFPGWKRL